ncbi:DUF2062 domain-containing protein [Halioxenophilus sp. WMMB6]|uniref:DUF2062 domain-containing protein n=1 Tax=Halioxenophilus sp. WMMB6 TaxID=3073815 RepID=UPI00295E83A5|nr:DUF2062 domain-containing protein [Halioxenophilus sp. WMMB6]
MARKLFKRWMPDPTKFKQNKAFSFLGDLLHDPNLFHLNRHSVSVAFFFGLAIAFLPVPGQMAIGAACCWFARCNLPITFALIWISNPLTLGPIFFSTYKLGTWILNSPVNKFHIELSWQWLTTELANIWAPLLVGSLLTGVVSGILGYLLIQAFWRWQVVRHWNLRRKRRAEAQGARGKSENCAK